MKRLKHNAARTAARWAERERLRDSRESHYIIQEETGLYWAGHAAAPPSPPILSHEVRNAQRFDSLQDALAHLSLIGGYRGDAHGAGAARIVSMPSMCVVMIPKGEGAL